LGVLKNSIEKNKSSKQKWHVEPGETEEATGCNTGGLPGENFFQLSDQVRIMGPPDSA
jgi:hypothetical protein